MLLLGVDGECVMFTNSADTHRFWLWYVYAKHPQTNLGCCGGKRDGKATEISGPADLLSTCLAHALIASSLWLLAP